MSVKLAIERASPPGGTWAKNPCLQTGKAPREQFEGSAGESTLGILKIPLIALSSPRKWLTRALCRQYPKEWFSRLVRSEALPWSDSFCSPLPS